MRAKGELLQAGPKAASFKVTAPGFLSERASLRSKTVQYLGEIARCVQVWCFFMSQLIRTKGVEFNAKQAKTSSNSREAGSSLYSDQKKPAWITHWRCYCGVSDVEWSVKFNMSHVCWRKQLLQLVVMETKCMLLTGFTQLTGEKAACFLKEALSYTKTAGWHEENTIGLFVPEVSLWAGQLQSAG